MGMDYCWSGSASYPRFYKELSAVANIFGGTALSDKNGLNFSFPDGTDPVLVRWFNNPCDDFTPMETRVVWEHISKHKEIKEISYQIWNELEVCVELNWSWYIY